MRLFRAVALVALLAVPAHAQTAPVPGYGEPDPDKTRSQVEAERAAERAYKRSLGSVPDAGPRDPWGSVRSDVAPKQAPAKRTKSANPAN